MRQILRASVKVRRRGQELRDIARGFPRMLAAATPRSSSEPIRLRFVYRDIGAPTCYRVWHQIEQAQLAGMAVQAAPLDDAADLYDLTSCDLLYLYRLALAPPTLALCVAARLRGIPVVFDSDDLVWHPQEREYNYLDDHYPPDRVARILWTTRRIYALMRWADAFVFSTRYLADLAAQTFRQPAYVNPNALSQTMLADAAAAYIDRQQRLPDDHIVVGYFCGQAHVHDEDMASIAAALCHVLDHHPHVRLRVYGELRLVGRLAEPPYIERIERRPAVGWRELPRHIAQVDINIAPLVDNPQRRAKSAVKYLEAALVGVPTIAARLDPYQHDIVEDTTGLLATTNDEWTASLARLVAAPDLRCRLGQAARTHVLAQHTTAARAPNFAAIIKQVTA